MNLNIKIAHSVFTKSQKRITKVSNSVFDKKV